MIYNASPAENIDPPYQRTNTIDLTEVNIFQDNKKTDEDNHQNVKGLLTENIIEYLLQHAKQHCSKCFVNHTPHPRWCNKINRSIQKQKIEKKQ